MRECHKLFSCECVGKKWSHCTESICLCAVQSSCDYICPPLPLSFSLLWGDSRVKSWTAAKGGRPTMQLKLLQAKQEETQRAIVEEKEEKTKWEKQISYFFLPLPVSLLCVCLCFFSYPLLKPYCICPPLLAGGNCRAGGLDGVGGTLGSESAAEERNKCINNKRRHDVRLRGCPTCCWLNLSLHGRTGLYAPHVCACVFLCTVWTCVLSIVVSLRLVEFKQRSQTFEVRFVFAVSV